MKMQIHREVWKLAQGYTVGGRVRVEVSAAMYSCAGCVLPKGIWGKGQLKLKSCPHLGAEL